MISSSAAVWRSLLFMPGDERRKIDKASQLQVDGIIMDLEDGVALTRKAVARDSVKTALGEISFGDRARLVRINAIDTTLWQDDLDAIMMASPDGIVIPKVESAEQLKEFCLHLERLEQNFAVRVSYLLAIVETALGVVNLRDIVNAHSRLSALVFGAEDFSGDIGATRTADGEEVAYARSAVVVHAKARKLAAIDTPFIEVADEQGLEKETRRGLRLGYTGKLAIHPRQVEVINRVYTPNAEEVRYAVRLIEEHNKQQSSGKGVFLLDGKMIDMPLVRAAEVVVQRARTAGFDLDAL